MTKVNDELIWIFTEVVRTLSKAPFHQIYEDIEKKTG
jgi:hypothetical protein